MSPRTLRRSGLLPDHLGWALALALCVVAGIAGCYRAQDQAPLGDPTAYVQGHVVYEDGRHADFVCPCTSEANSPIEVCDVTLDADYTDQAGLYYGLAPETGDAWNYDTGIYRDGADYVAVERGREVTRGPVLWQRTDGVCGIGTWTAPYALPLPSRAIR